MMLATARRAVFEAACRAAVRKGMTLREYLEGKLDELCKGVESGRSVSNSSGANHSAGFFPGEQPGGPTAEEKGVEVWQLFLELVSEYEAAQGADNTAGIKAAVLNDDRMRATNSFRTDFSSPCRY